ncbi:fluoride efflux transporter CrcB [Neobacillus sp. MER 74]|uniref:fluoride efflux transporter CrcB n=1 Tax=Neobacillus sp. MER 74 TaxID=2939566 RepID=UPI00203DA73D|nr:fluoride efflux transporter CrcB [Neobacillus sp. MER 74]MCM3117207.1 fluoride efflux transporter CrcB [Neobacillus sp. MER 74]
MITNIALVAVGGFFGAMSRFGLSILIKGKYPSTFPLATLIINLFGSFLLGLIFGANLENTWRLLMGTGFMGAFTTFSTFKLENIQLLTKRNWKMIILYLGMSYTFGILLAFIGMKLGSLFL